MRKLSSLIVSALLIGLGSVTASAAPLYELEVLGSTSASGPFTSSLQVAANTQYFYEVVAVESPIGTTNANAGRTITSVSSADGFNSASFNVNDTASSATPVTFSNSALNSTWTGGLSQSPGTLNSTSTGINGVRPIAAAGTFFGATAPAVMFTGTFTTGSTVGASSTIDLSWGGVTGSAKINSGANSIVINGTGNETGADPVVGFSGLTLTGQTAVPEPASLIMMGTSFAGIAGLTVLRRRRRGA